MRPRLIFYLCFAVSRLVVGVNGFCRLSQAPSDPSVFTSSLLHHDVAAATMVAGRASRRRRSADFLLLLRVVSDDEALEALERLEAIDAKLGVGIGATKERAKLNDILEQWEQNGESSMNQDEATAIGVLAEQEEDYDADTCDVENDTNCWDNDKIVAKHSSNERVAIFGGDPARRRQSVEKKLAPYKVLDQFGTPKDVGPSDTSNILRKINNGNYDVVYLWTRFNCHTSRKLIREACLQTGTRIEEVNSLSYIR